MRGAFPGNSERCFVVEEMNELIALDELEAAGFVTRLSRDSERFTWSLSSLALVSLSLKAMYVAPTLVGHIRCDALPLPDRSKYELVILLEEDGWS